MDWQLELITLYLEVCKYWQEGGWVQAQRYAPYADLSFTDEEAFTLYLFAVVVENKLQIKDIHTLARRYWCDWFPRMPGYEKTGIEIASKVRSYQGLMIHVFGRLAAAMFVRNVLPQSA